MKGLPAKYELFEDIFSGTFFLSGVTLIFYGVIMRYIFKAPVFWVDEVSTYVLVWGAILGWSIAQRDGRHIRVTILYERFPVRVQRWVSIFSRSLSLLFCLFLAYLGFLLELKYLESHQLSINTQLPLWIAYFFVPVAALMLGLRFYVELRFLLKDGGAEWIKNRREGIGTGGSGH